MGITVEALGFPNPVSVDFSGADAATQESLVASLPYSVAVLHTVFNVITTLILVWFIPQLVKMVTWMVPSKGEEKEVYRLKYIGIGNIATGDLALNSAKMEVVEFGRLCRRDLGYIRNAINAGTLAEFEEADKKLVHYEEITDNVEREIATYLRDVSKNEMSIGGLSAASRASANSIGSSARWSPWATAAKPSARSSSACGSTNAISRTTCSSS